MIQEMQQRRQDYQPKQFALIELFAAPAELVAQQEVHWHQLADYSKNICHTQYFWEGIGTMSGHISFLQKKVFVTQCFCNGIGTIFPTCYSVVRA